MHIWMCTLDIGPPPLYKNGLLTLELPGNMTKHQHILLLLQQHSGKKVIIGDNSTYQFQDVVMSLLIPSLEKSFMF
jgi:hypothetical protein